MRKKHLEREKRHKGTTRHLKLPPLCKLNLRFSGILRSVDWYLVTDMSGKPLCPIFKMGEIGCPETSVSYYQLTLRTIPEKQKFQSESTVLTNVPPHLEHHFIIRYLPGFAGVSC
jgi:hypothetical protein